MKIKDGWEFDDGVTGVSIKVSTNGGCLSLRLPDGMQRDFFFSKKGNFDWTGACCWKPCKKME